MVELSIGKMKMKDFVKWQEAVKNAASENNYEALYALQAQVVSAWDFPGDPTVADSYGELTLEQWHDFQKQAAEVISNRFST